MQPAPVTLQSVRASPRPGVPHACDCQRLNQCAFQSAHIVRQLEAESRLMSTYSGTHRLPASCEKDNILAEIVFPDLQNSQCPQVLPGSIATRSPTFRFFTFAPTSTTLPPASCREQTVVLQQITDASGLVVMQVRAADSHILTFTRNSSSFGCGIGRPEFPLP